MVNSCCVELLRGDKEGALGARKPLFIAPKRAEGCSADRRPTNDDNSWSVGHDVCLRQSSSVSAAAVAKEGQRRMLYENLDL